MRFKKLNFLDLRINHLDQINLLLECDSVNDQIILPFTPNMLTLSITINHINQFIRMGGR